MSVTDEQPTKVGQRVQEIFTDSRGWVVGQTIVDGEPMSEVVWDEPNDLDGDLFPDDALRVVKVIMIDVDHFMDPSLHPMVESSRTEGYLTIYKLKTGQVIKGTEMMRIWLTGYSTKA